LFGSPLGGKALLVVTRKYELSPTTESVVDVEVNGITINAEDLGPTAPSTAGIPSSASTGTTTSK
jgi:hypothetical protein